MLVQRATVLGRLAARQAIFNAVRTKHTLPDLPYDYGALEPFISAQIMELHHSKHHATYVAGLNTAEEQLAEALQAKDVKKAITLQRNLNFNGGGHINHSLFWEGLAPERQGGGQLPDGPLADAIKRDFGSFEALKDKLNAASLGIQGSGWAWLGLNPTNQKLELFTTANQDPLTAAVPLLGIDMWEHAFYLQHQNKKPPYLENIWHVLNLKKADERFKAAS